MNVPAPFQSVFAQWQTQDITVIDANWTSNLKRHVCAKVRMPDGQLGFVKLAINNKRDLDETDMLSGMQREVWWSRMIQALRQHRPDFPFTSPKVLQTNVDASSNELNVSWIIFEHINGKPMIDWDITANLEPTHEELAEKFFRFEKKAAECLFTLDHITHDILEEIGMDDVPSLPHGSRRWLRKGLMTLDTAVLGNGAFEIGNIWETDDGQIVIMDNEFAGWYPRYDSLSYLYHRLWCNCMRPDLASYVCIKYLEESNRAHAAWVDDFTRDLSRILQPRILGGWYYDTVRRRLPPWHKKQLLRYKLYWRLRQNHSNVLYAKDFP